MPRNTLKYTKHNIQVFSQFFFFFKYLFEESHGFFIPCEENLQIAGFLCFRVAVGMITQITLWCEKPESAADMTQPVGVKDAMQY